MNTEIPASGDPVQHSQFEQELQYATDGRVEELRKQRDELFRQVEEHLKHIDQAIHPDIPSALKDFLDFFQDYNHYFWNEAMEAKISVLMAYERVLSTALDNTRRVWTTLSQAINQRFNPVYAKRLERADTIAKYLLDRTGDIVTKPPIIYSDKIFHITRYPYQSHPLLGLPLDRCEHDAQCAGAHELGHYLFWNNGDMEQYKERTSQLRKIIACEVFDKDLSIDTDDLLQFEQQITAKFERFHIWIQWAEEAFADACGALISGPLYAKSAQDILVRERVGVREDLVHNDGKHPIPALRPFIALEVLKAVAQRANNDFAAAFNDLLDILEERWRPYWEASKKINIRSHRHERDAPSVPPADLEPYLKPIIQQMLEAKLFQTDGDLVSLIDSVDYWGKQGSQKLSSASFPSREATQPPQQEVSLGQNPHLGGYQESIEEIRRLAEAYRRDSLGPVPPHQSKANGDNPLGTPPPANGSTGFAPGAPINPRPFDRLLTFIRSERQKRLASGKILNTQEWEDVLAIELELMHTHSNEATHSHPIKHKHVGGQIVLC
jgi:hypothetical protein